MPVLPVTSQCQNISFPRDGHYITNPESVEFVLSSSHTSYN